ncbi:putative peptidase S10, serine carboxypeptidase, alpha/Beta hydrolase [Helianthus anomalus]
MYNIKLTIYIYVYCQILNYTHMYIVNFKLYICVYYEKLRENNANVIFLDLPAGVGFSYATTWEGWRSSDSILAKHSYEFLRKWFVEHPNFLSNPLYITGISYMGILVPPVALEVYKGKHAL